MELIKKVQGEGFEPSKALRRQVYSLIPLASSGTPGFGYTSIIRVVNLIPRGNIIVSLWKNVKALKNLFLNDRSFPNKMTAESSRTSH